MEKESELRPWDELISDTLGLIFRNLSLEEKLLVVPCVCKAWGEIVNGPYCWQEIDIENWSCQYPHNVDRMVRMLISRSGGSFQKLCVSELPCDTFAFIADNAHALKSLELYRGHMTDSIIEQVIPKLASVTMLNLSYCNNLGPRGIVSIGEHCKSLTWFRCSMHPGNYQKLGITSQKNEAHAIATSMPNLKHLGITYMLVDTDDVLKILESCRSLESLDLRGCWNVKLDKKFIKEKFPELKILEPIIGDDLEDNYLYECSDDETIYDSDSTDGGFVGGRYSFTIYPVGWPPSP